MFSGNLDDAQSSALTPQQLEKILSSIDIPVCPVVVTKALLEAQSDDPDLPRLARLIAEDPSMSATALKLANSVIYRSANPVASVRHAVERLGTQAVVSIIVAVALHSTVKGLSEAWLNQFWRRITQVAVIAALVARHQFGIAQDTAYTYALFHHAAIPMMMKRFDGYEAMLKKAKTDGELLIDSETALFPCTHTIVGSLMVRNWGLPAIIGLAIRFHHDPEAYELPDQTLPGSALSLIAVTHIAQRLISEMFGERDCEVGAELFAKALAFIGLSDNELDDLRPQVEATLAAP
ncbi:MAG: metal dependent phosphohydrolase [Proteobacteria bacterium]|nr:metal dependent phosphohydrolase [Pseudomonadota bacterium]